MVDHLYVSFDYDDPSSATNANLVPAELLQRALTALHQVMIAGGVAENWKLQKLNTLDVEVEELPDKILWSHKAGNEKLRATFTRDGAGLVTQIVYAFAPDGISFSTIKTQTLNRGPGGGVLNVDWA